MKTKTTRRRLRRHARSFVECLREFLTPILWKQAHFQRHSERRSSRWSTQPLVLVLLLVLRRLAARAFRDRQGFLHCLFTETTTTGADGPGLSKGVGEIADGSFAGDHGRHSADAGVAVGLALRKAGDR